MIRLYELRLPLDYTPEQMIQACARRLGVRPRAVAKTTLMRRGIDARRGREIRWICTVDVTLTRGERAALAGAKKAELVETLSPPAPLPRWRKELPPVIVGAGPAGLFCALALARAGARPVLLERGSDVERRTAAVEAFWRQGSFSPQTNVQFGEGGAGTFSDGKLTTGIRDPRVRQVLTELYQLGAPEEILVDALPHIGTDRLRQVLLRLRRELLQLGAEIRFETRVTDLIVTEGRVTGVRLETGEDVAAAAVVLAPGHSARDTFQMLVDRGVALAQKPFAMGVRIEHPQEWVSQRQYGAAADRLPPAPYKLSAHLPDGRGVYTFCMCPGGVVVAASSEPETVVTNGMSYYARDGENANAALLAAVTPQDLASKEVLAGAALQQAMERRAFLLAGGGYRAPAQRVEDFLIRRPSRGFGDVTPSYRPGVTPGDLWELLPPFLAESLAAGLPLLARQMPGFDQPDAVLTGPETRSSSPVRILRDDRFQSVTLPGLYPCGEGAGYAGGIVSAAVDGLRVAQALATENE